MIHTSAGKINLIVFEVNGASDWTVLAWFSTRSPISSSNRWSYISSTSNVTFLNFPCQEVLYDGQNSEDVM